jgi:hypothetical protein
MANIQHRLRQVPRGPYSLRGNPPVATTLQQTATQQRKNAVAKSVSKNWRITRLNKRSRGLRRAGLTCYRLSGMQALLHLPRFVNWISSHNSKQPDGTVQFPCRPLNQVETALVAKLSFPGTKLQLTRCPACVVKNFAQAYWDNVDMDGQGRPLFWPRDHEHMRRLSSLDRRLFPLTTGAADGGEQDPVEFQERLLEACLASTDHT